MIQYDFFRQTDPFDDIKADIADNKDSIRRTQRRFFAQNKELVGLITKQQKEIDELNNRITRLTNERK